jgi:ubiquinone/menaquinone biosynthesis C-methylase UbiE/uncharacterized protein YbaR (Trm112 family)
MLEKVLAAQGIAPGAEGMTAGLFRQGEWPHPQSTPRVPLLPGDTMMDQRILSVLCDPVTHEELQMRRETDLRGAEKVFLVNPASGRKFSIRDGIPCFIGPAEVSGPNKKYQELYDRIARGYDLGLKLYGFFRGQDLRGMRRGYLEEIKVKEQDRVLEVSVGTGLNISFLQKTAEFYGLDISWRMLKKCQRNLANWKRHAHLFLGTAEQLPFRNESFDVVFHFGGINFFTDRAAAIREMIRVAKAGTKIIISDETERHVKSNYEKVPFVGKHFKGRKEEVRPPIDLVPKEMLDLQLKEFREGTMYCLSFRKPRV